MRNEDPDEAVAFGRVQTADDRWYIGKGAIWDDDNDLVVVNWQAPIAAPFYTATPDDPEGLDARRIFRCTGNQIREIEDVLFHEVAQAITEGRTPAPVLTDALLDALGALHTSRARLTFTTPNRPALVRPVPSEQADGAAAAQPAPGYLHLLMPVRLPG